MKKCRYLLPVMALLLSISMTGCQNQRKEPSKNNAAEGETAIIDFPSSYQKDYDNQLRVDAKIIVPDKLKGKSLRGAKAKLIKPDVEAVRQKTEEYLGTNLQEFLFTEQKDYQGTPLYIYQYADPQDSVFSITYSDDQNSLLYSPQEMSYVRTAFRLADDPGYNADLFQNDEEFPFESRQDAFMHVKQYLEDVGIIIGDEYRCYSLPYETLRQEEIVYEEDRTSGKGEWTEEDNAYYFAINQEANGLPVYIPMYGIYAADIDYNAPIQIMYKASGIGFIETGTMYEITSADTYVNPLRIEEVFECIKEKYDMLISDEEIILTQAKLCWIPDKASEDLILGWSIRGKTSAGESLQMFYDAQTGKELLGVSL